MSPALRNLANQALSLEEDSRAELASILLQSLEEAETQDKSIELAWLEEANRRDQELASGAVEGRPWEEVLTAARERLR